jgi:GT2 family glycosyltransferase
VGSAPKLAIVIVSWNTCRLLSDCLSSIYKTVRRYPFDVIVVDNASSDGSAEHVRREYPQVRLIERVQSGLRSRNNVALSQIHSDYVLLLNPDTVAHEGAIDRLCDVLELLPTAGAVGAQLLNPDGTPQHSWGRFPTAAREVPLLRNLFSAEAESFLVSIGDQHLSLLRVDWAKGASLMIRSAALAQVGLLDEDYWLYTEETDWCYRARQMGWDILVRPDAFFTHIEQASSGQRLGKSFVNFADSRVLFARKTQGRLAAGVVWGVFAARSLVWYIFPSRSHLGRPEAGYSGPEVRAAYKTYLQTSLGRFLDRS